MNRNQKIRTYLFILFLASALVFIYSFPRLTLPFGFAYIIYLMIRPFTIRIRTGSNKQKIGYLLLIISGLSFLLFPFIATINNVDTDFTSLTNQIPEVQKVLQEKFFALKVTIFEKTGYKLNIDPVGYFIKKLELNGAELISLIPNYISNLFEWVLLVPLFIYFLFFESKKLNKKILDLVPNSIFEKSYVLFSQFNTKFGEYIIAKFIEATILGTIVTIGLATIGFPYLFILGFFAGITNILPYIGPFIGVIPAIFIALLNSEPNVSVFGIIIVYSIANLIDMILVFPLLVSKIVNLHPILVLISIIVGSQLGGIIGMIIIIPFIAFIKIVFKEIYKDLTVNL